MGINELHASHIRQVRGSFSISGQNLIPEQVTEAIGIQPDHSAHRGDEKRNYKGQIIGTHSESFWVLSTEGKVESKDINGHLRYLLLLLLPHREVILKIAESGETHFDVVWKSTYLYAGTGPVIDRDCLYGVAQLEAGMGFDIYQVDEE